MKIDQEIAPAGQCISFCDCVPKEEKFFYPPPGTREVPFGTAKQRQSGEITTNCDVRMQATTSGPALKYRVEAKKMELSRPPSDATTPTAFNARGGPWTLLTT